MSKNIFFEELNKINHEYAKELKAHENFNIVRALHNINDERRLHSRFIAYLLSPKSKHGMKELFLKKFIELIPELRDFDLETEIYVFPNEIEKSEKNNIDILIENKIQNMAIIIENKIYAGDSNHDGKPQMLIYFDRKKDELGYKNQDQEAIKNIKLVYLTLDRHKPTLYEEFNKRNIVPTIIDYRNEIKHWLEECINNDLINDFLKEILRQYLNVTTQLTNDALRAKELQKLISYYIDLAWNEECESKKISKMGDFIHVKWHTVDDFWIELISDLEKELKAIIIGRITTDEITKQTHKDNKKPYGILIEIHEIQLYIMNDAKNGLTIGFPSSPVSRAYIKNNQNWCTIDNNIKFSDFSTEVTFRLIKKDNRENLIKKTLKAIEIFTSK
ncbi:MAG: PD-(D/E)XK nuclease family protein [Paludibacter sp.]